MTDIEQKALALLNEVRKERHYSPWMKISREHPPSFEIEALCRAIEAHEAFKQEVSDAVDTTLSMLETHCDAEGFVFASNQLLRFITHKPKPKPDPLVAAMKEVGLIPLVNQLRAALEARGFEIREKSDD
jgi:hypothetical protein